MQTALTDNELNHLLKFVLYGNLDAEVWFIGMEEAGGGESNIRTRLKFGNVEDCASAHSQLGITKHHSGKKIIQPTWRGMCYVMLAREDKPTDTGSIRDYQASMLGSQQGNSLLCELMPIPKPNLGTWEYQTLIPQYSSAKEYYSTEKPKRIQYLHSLLKIHSPKLIVCYGKKYWNDYETLFNDMKFIPEGSFSSAQNSKSLVILTHHFTATSMNSELQPLVNLAKAAMG